MRDIASRVLSTMLILSLSVNPFGFIVSQNQSPLYMQQNYTSIERDWENVTLLHEQQYHDTTLLEDEIENIAMQVPNLVDVAIIGQSYLEQNIYSIRITNEEITAQKAKVLVVAHHHGREQVTVEIALRFVLRLLNSYGIDDTITEYVDTEEIYVIPTVNPDALDVVVNEGNHWLRKNLRPYDDDGDGAFDEDSLQDVDGDGIISSFDVYLKAGELSNPVYSHSYYEGIDDDFDGLVNEDNIGLVDLNRNYDIFWDPSESPLSDPSSSTYAGTSPFSEPETQTFRDFVEQHRFAMAYSLHTGINATYLPANPENEFAEPELYPNILNDFALLLPSGYNTGWTYDGSSTRSRNLASATLSGVWREWMYYERGTIAPIAFELYTNATSRGSEVESVYLENETHLIIEWNGIFGFFNPLGEYIDTLWSDLILSFDYLLEMTPRIKVEAISFFLDEEQPTIGHVQIETLCKGNRIGTVNPIQVLLANGTVVFTGEILFPGSSDELSLEIFTKRDRNENLTLMIGNDYVGYTEIILLIPAIEPQVDIFILTGIIVVGFCAILVLRVFSKKK